MLWPMNIASTHSRCLNLLLFFVPLLLIFSPAAFGQKSKTPVSSAQPLAAASLVRTTTRHEVRRLGYGGTLTLIGAPEGSIVIEAWSKNEVDITADIQVRAASEDDLAKLAAVDGFFLDSTANHLRIMTTGSHDKVFMKKTAKDFPKQLLGVPFRIDYRLKVPAAVDLDIDAGQGAFTLSGVEGAITFKSNRSDVRMDLVGGAVRAVVGIGKVDVNITSRSWRGQGADIQLAAGTMTVSLPPGFNADIDASVLRAGKLEDTFGGITPREDEHSTERVLHGRAGNGGATLSFTVADGTLRFIKSTE
jgi:hypothetical protein